MHQIAFGGRVPPEFAGGERTALHRPLSCILGKEKRKGRVTAREVVEEREGEGRVGQGKGR